MRITNSKHVPWFFLVVLATLFACWLYVGNFHPQRLPTGMQLPARFVQTPSEHHSVGGTPLGLSFGAISLAIFVFAALLSLRKKIPLWRVGTVQRWLRAHIWLTLLTIPLIILHSGFRLGGPMTTLLMALYLVVMVSGIYGLVLQHLMPRLMKERLPAETVFEQIPHIRAQLYVAAEKMRDSFKPVPPKKTDAAAPAASATKTVTAGSAVMASTKGDLSTPVARAKSAVGSAVIAAPVATAATPVVEASTSPRVIMPAASPAAAKPAVAPAKPTESPSSDPASEATLIEFIERQILPYLGARRGDKMRLNNPRFSDDTFRFVKLRVAEAYRSRVEEIQGWCDERRMLDLQTRLQHWLHGWLFIHVPISFLLLMLTFWHAYVTLFIY